jgi:disulfide bond formation protein DsbB
MFPVETINHLLGLATFALNIATMAFLALYFLQKRFVDLQDIAALLRRWGMWLGLLLAVGATAMTLFYSEILGFAPCGWCWVQRVFLWPQVFLFAVALYVRDRTVAHYSIVLSIFGAAAGLYQHYLQMGGNALIPCPASGAGDCAQRILFELGYVTFPFMAFSLFAFLIVLMLFVREKS